MSCPADLAGTKRAARPAATATAEAIRNAKRVAAGQGDERAGAPGEVVRPRGSDRRQHGEPDGAAYLARGVHQPGSQARLVPGDTGRRRVGQRREGDTEPEGDEHARHEEAGPVGRVHAQPGEEEEPHCREPGTDHEQGPRSEAQHQPRRDLGPDHDRECLGYESDARPEGRVAVHELQVERDEEPHREQGGRQQEHDEVGGPYGSPFEKGEPHERGIGDEALRGARTR